MTEIKIADCVADFLAQQGVQHVFGIIGSANAHLFDSVYRHPDLELVCLHHEQACVMAAHGYYKQSGRMAAVLVTAGAGITNALTGVVGSWADSVPVLILSGQESTKQFNSNNLARMIGIQGVYVESIYQTCTKSVVTCQEPVEVLYELAKALNLAKSDRLGPCIVDIPIDLQAKSLDVDLAERALKVPLAITHGEQPGLTPENLKQIVDALQKSKAPLLWLGNGLRRFASDDLRTLVNGLAIPYLTSWTATDLFSPIDGLYAGHAGTYGGRAGNIILQSCDLLITLGTRLAIPQRGYVDEELARRAEIFVVDCDQVELDKLGPRFSNQLLADAPTALSQIYAAIQDVGSLAIEPWLEHIIGVRKSLPLVEDCHRNDTYVDSYSFIEYLGSAASPYATFVTDMGTALISGFQVIEPSAGQRLFTSQGLGEMGYGLPGAIGAWFADPQRQIICLNCDGGLMMNLQDLHSVISLAIPMKIVIFNNDGYLMIKHTQNAIVAGRRAGTDVASGLSCPEYESLVKAFGFSYLSLRKENDSEAVIREFLEADAPIVLEVYMAPEQLLVPKLSVSISADGKLVSPPLEDLSPLMPLDTLERSLLVPLLPKSIQLNRMLAEAKGDAIY
jgi:acetolactate synthase-1/2/3 large subunit